MPRSWLPSRFLRLGLIIPGSIFALTAAGCGNGVLSTSEGPDNMAIQPYDTVAVDESLGDGSSLQIRGARSTVDHDLEVLVDGFSCGRPSGVDADETDDAVNVVVRGALIGDGDCPSDIVPWFVPVELAGPLADREVTNGDQHFRVVDCRANPKSRLCNPPA